jgi:hypothetical protein
MKTSMALPHGRKNETRRAMPFEFESEDARLARGERVRLLHETLREGLALLYYEVAGYL